MYHAGLVGNGNDTDGGQMQMTLPDMFHAPDHLRNFNHVQLAVFTINHPTCSFRLAEDTTDLMRHCVPQIGKLINKLTQLGTGLENIDYRINSVIKSITTEWRHYKGLRVSRFSVSHYMVCQHIMDIHSYASSICLSGKQSDTSSLHWVIS